MKPTSTRLSAFLLCSLLCGPSLVHADITREAEDVGLGATPSEDLVVDSDSSAGADTIGRAQGLFIESLERYARSMSEFQKEVEKRVKVSKWEQERLIQENFTDKIGRTIFDPQGASGKQLLEQQQRAKAIRQLKEFECKYAGMNAVVQCSRHEIKAYGSKPMNPIVAKHRPDVLFRLAELFVEESDQQYDMAFEQAMAKGELAPDQQDVTNIMRIYAEIEDEYSELKNGDTVVREAYSQMDLVYLALAYYTDPINGYQTDAERLLNEGVDENGEPRDGATVSFAYYKKLLDNHPDSEHVALANFMVGRYYFVEAQEFDLARARFQAVIDLEYNEGRWYDEGLYFLGWTHYNQASSVKPEHYRLALERMDELLVWYDRIGSLQKNKKEGMKSEAIKYSAIALTDMSDSARNALEVAKEFYASREGTRNHDRDVYLQLAEKLRSKTGRELEAIAVYQYLQDEGQYVANKEWWKDPENPDLQWAIYEILLGLESELYGDLSSDADIVAGLQALGYVEASGAAEQALRKLQENYQKGGKWALANQARPDAVNKAQRYIRQTAVRVAEGYLGAAARANRYVGQDAALHNIQEAYANYKKAVVGLTAYIQNNPNADDVFLMTYNLADAHLWLAELCPETSKKEGCPVSEPPRVVSSDFDRAERFHRQLSEKKGHFFTLASKVRLVSVASQRLQKMYDSATETPGNAQIRMAEQNEFGQTITTYAIGDEHQEYIDAIDSVIGLDFNPIIEKNEAALLEAIKVFEAHPEDDVMGKTEASDAKVNLEISLNINKGLSDYVRESALALSYNVALIQYNFGYYEDARRRFREIIDNPKWRESDLAQESALNIVRTYSLEGDQRMVAQVSRELAALNIGPPGDESSLGQLSEYEQNSVFNLAYEKSASATNMMKEQGPEDPEVRRMMIEAADDYAAYYDQYKNKAQSDQEKANLKSALIQAANLYEGAGDKTNAIARLEEYVAAYATGMEIRVQGDVQPALEALSIQRGLAGLYVTSLDLEQAITGYRSVYDAYKSFERVANSNRGISLEYTDSSGGVVTFEEEGISSLNYAAFYSLGLGTEAGFQNAANWYKEYGDNNASRSDAQDVYFQAGKAFEALGIDAAIGFYETYLNKYRNGAKIEHFMEAKVQLVLLSQKKMDATDTSNTRAVRNNKRKLDGAWSSLKEAYEKLKSDAIANGQTEYDVLPAWHLAHGMIYEYELNQYQVKIDEFMNPSRGNFVDTLQDFVARQSQMGELFNLIGQSLTNDETYTGMYFYLGNAYLHLFNETLNNQDKLLRGLPSSIDKDIFWFEFENAQLYPMKDYAEASYMVVMDHAKKAGFWSEWQTKTSAILAAEFPNQKIPEEKQEIRGQIQDKGIPVAPPQDDFGLTAESSPNGNSETQGGTE